VDSHLLVTPAIFKPGSMVFKNQRKSKNVDSRLKISGMTESTIRGRCPLINPRKRRKHKKTKEKDKK